MFRYHSKIFALVISFVLASAWFTGLMPAVGPLAANVDRPDETQSNFANSGQGLGGDVESSAAALGDLDADGDLDSVVAGFGGPSKVYLNQGVDQGGTQGVFLDSGQSLAASMAVDVELQDLDGDGDLDAFLVKDAFEDSNEVWLNQGDATGVFQQTGQIFGDSLSTSVALGDLDGINGPDAFVGRGFGQPSKVWFNSGNGTFSDSGQALDTGSSDIALGDLDGDNDLDAFSANGADNKVWVNQGGAQMGAAGIFLDSGQLLTSALSLSAALGDVDGDGDLDAWVGNSGDDRIWVNQGGAQGGSEGAFQGGALTSSNQTRDVLLGDLDGDGDLDAFLAKDAGNEVWINQGGDQGGSEGAYLESGQSLGNARSEGLALGDVDGDGDLDAFVANWGQPDRVWLNQASVPSADVSVILPATSSSVLDICPSGSISFRVTVRNAGPSAAENVTVSTSRGLLTFPSFQAIPKKTVNIGRLNPGESVVGSLDVVHRPLREGPVVCVAGARVDVTADQLDPDVGNNRGHAQHAWFSCDNPGCVLGAYLACDEAAGTRRLHGRGQERIAILERLLGLAGADIDLLVYQFIRDTVLAGTEDGSHFTNLFYAHESEIQSLLADDPALEAEAVATLQLWEPNLWALVRGEGGTAKIAAGQVDAIDIFLANLAAAGSIELQDTIAAERDRLPPLHDFAGMTMDEARGRIVGYSAYLPLTTNP